MTEVEDRVRDLLQDVANEARPTPMLSRLTRHAPVAARRRRLVVAATAAAVMVAAAGAVLALERLPGDAALQPAEQPPTVFRLSGVTTAEPGRATMCVTFSSSSGTSPPPPAHLVGRDGGQVVALAPAVSAPYSGRQRLSADGTKVLRQNFKQVGASLVLADLETGRSRDYEGDGFIETAELSPDNRTIAWEGQQTMGLIDVGSGEVHTLRIVNPQPGPRILGWSPDSTLLAIRDNSATLIIDTSAKERRRLPDTVLANDSMSWSPDGRAILAYDNRQRAFVVVPINGDARSVLRSPPGGTRALGWTGSRVVWLVGAPGAPGTQSLVTTNQRGGDVQQWVRFDVDEPVESVSWSRALSGAPKPRS